MLMDLSHYNHSFGRSTYLGKNLLYFLYLLAVIGVLEFRSLSDLVWHYKTLGNALWKFQFNSIQKLYLKMVTQ